ncbi:MAG: hypothetical protein AAB443_04170 [Patescibacteria group bacterium]
MVYYIKNKKYVYSSATTQGIEVKYLGRDNSTGKHIFRHQFESGYERILLTEEEAEKQISEIPQS